MWVSLVYYNVEIGLHDNNDPDEKYVYLRDRKTGNTIMGIPLQEAFRLGNDLKNYAASRLDKTPTAVA